jgi:hypothetical protein
MSEVQLAKAADLVGAATAVGYFVLITVMFLLRLAASAHAARWVGLTSFLAIIPLAFLLVAAFKTHRPPIYFIWLGLMTAFLIFELVADDIMALDFRSNIRDTILYVTFFFAATGGMIGVAAQAGREWKGAAIALFIIMAVMAFVQRAITGL